MKPTASAHAAQRADRTVESRVAPARRGADGDCGCRDGSGDTEASLLVGGDNDEPGEAWGAVGGAPGGPEALTVA